MTASSPQTPPRRDDRLARRNVAILVAAQALLGSQITLQFTIGGLAGQMLAPNPCLATLPISMIVFGSMTTAPWISPLMQRRGRTAGFLIGAGGGMAGAALSAAGVALGSFWLLLLGSYLTGIYMSAQGFYRFAAADTASEAFRPKAISYVLAGGLLSALIGPQLVKVTGDLTVVPFVGSYAAAAALNLAGIVLFPLLALPRPGPRAADAAPDRGVRALLTTPGIAVAVIVGAVSYALMNLVMTSTPLAVVGCGFTRGDAADIVSAHVLAMFVPSFFTGHLIARFGAARIVAAGLVLLGGAGVIALAGVELGNFFGALVLLGLGWNFGFIGATAMLTSFHTAEERGRVQGLNDMIVFGSVTVASLASGGLMNCTGGTAEQGWSAVNLAMIPFLVLAAAALFWLARQPSAARA
ncbi:MFS transporter [Wenxinia saemankumensis]|uniref:Predicted arabinose efflux permease, MFS family n=1 Tax=Wenxinia saemankumensis TaxID=1447782 RepID=A0A1M5ZZA8_9RHOB|nr:MFS transporter [Wenxinia saemankumensis]SHI29591.1 Predicted arabinose efflux permease, MFS family [Wenxinia saemankumensis]